MEATNEQDHIGRVRTIDFTGSSDIEREEGQPIAVGLAQPDARRLAACWNACEGSATKDLEELGADYIKPLIKLIDERDALQAREAHLISALKAILATKPVSGLNPDARISDPPEVKVGWNVHALARAALAAAGAA